VSTGAQLALSPEDRLDRELLRHIDYLSERVVPQLCDWIAKDRELDTTQLARFVWRFMIVLKAYLKKKKGWTEYEVRNLAQNLASSFFGGKNT
jgi:hypothetical protein